MGDCRICTVYNFERMGQTKKVVLNRLYTFPDQVGCNIWHVAIPWSVEVTSIVLIHSFITAAWASFFRGFPKTSVRRSLDLGSAGV
jgi:hypothetical protein